MAQLGENQYGKARVRLSRIMRQGYRHEFNEWTITVLLQGEFAAAFTAADNSSVLPTDTMKNTVYSIARDSHAATIEQFALEVGDYLLRSNPQVSGARVEVQEKSWQRMHTGTENDATTFRMGGPEVQTTAAAGSREKGWAIQSGIDGLTILKTTHSEFTGYIQNRHTTLKPSTDRIFGTCAKVQWDFEAMAPDFAGARQRITEAILRVFTAHHSMSVQHTLYEMAEAALEAAPEIARIKLAMPNLHHILADLSPFGQDNPNHIFVPIDEPHGYIEATVER